MKTNMSSSDRIVRLFAAVALFVFITLFYTGSVTGTLSITAIVVAIILLGTAILGACPLYTLLGIRTCPKKPE